MFHHIDLNNLQKYFNDAGLDHIAPVNHTGTFTEVMGNFYNFVKRVPGTFNIKLLQDDTYAVCLNGVERYNLNYDEHNRCKVERPA